jgi:hypothetical protein
LVEQRAPLLMNACWLAYRVPLNVNGPLDWAVSAAAVKAAIALTRRTELQFMNASLVGKE